MRWSAGEKQQNGVEVQTGSFACSLPRVQYSSAQCPMPSAQWVLNRLAGWMEDGGLSWGEGGRLRGEQEDRGGGAAVTGGGE